MKFIREEKIAVISLMELSGAIAEWPGATRENIRGWCNPTRITAKQLQDKSSNGRDALTENRVAFYKGRCFARPDLLDHMEKQMYIKVQRNEKGETIFQRFSCCSYVL